MGFRPHYWLETNLSESGILLLSIKGINLNHFVHDKDLHIIHFSANILVYSLRFIHFLLTLASTYLILETLSKPQHRRTKTVGNLEESKRCEETEGGEERRCFTSLNINSTQTTHVLIDVKERCHDGILDGSQIRLVPEDLEHPPNAMAAGVVTGHVLQQKGLLTTGRRGGRMRGICMRRDSLQKKISKNPQSHLNSRRGGSYNWRISSSHFISDAEPGPCKRPPPAPTSSEPYMKIVHNPRFYANVSDWPLNGDLWEFVSLYNLYLFRMSWDQLDNTWITDVRWIYPLECAIAKQFFIDAPPSSTIHHLRSMVSFAQGAC